METQLVSSMCMYLNATATTEFYPLSLHDAHPNSGVGIVVGDADQVRLAPLALLHEPRRRPPHRVSEGDGAQPDRFRRDRKSTRLNSSHANISYAVFCLKKNIRLGGYQFV